MPASTPARAVVPRASMRPGGCLPRRRWRVADDRGMVTAETAIVLPTLAVVLLLALWALNVVALQVRCVDAAGGAARALARGEAPASVRADLGRVAPAGARVDLGRDGGQVVVEVQLLARLPGPWGEAAPGVLVRSRAVAMDERRAAQGAGDGLLRVAPGPVP